MLKYLLISARLHLNYFAGSFRTILRASAVKKTKQKQIICVSPFPPIKTQPTMTSMDLEGFNCAENCSKNDDKNSCRNTVKTAIIVQGTAKAKTMTLHKLQQV